MRKSSVRQFPDRAAPLMLALVLGLATPSVAPGQSNGVLREVYANIPGTALADLTNNPAFPASPTSESLESAFEAPVNWSDNYGQRMRALLLPPLTGEYTFWIASDDQGALFLSPDENPARKVLIARVNGWTSSREWTKETNQQSAPILLTNGLRYYIEALQKEGGGGDNLAVRWRLPNGAIEEPIPGARLVPYGLGPPIITAQPTNTTGVEGGFVTFSVQLERYLAARFQWFRNGLALAGATNATLTLGPLSLGDSGSNFRCAITNLLGSTNTATVTLTVLPDTTPPALVGAVNLGYLTVVSLFFSEPLEPASALNPANYTFADAGVTVLRAVFGPDARTIVLTTTPLALNSTHTVRVSGVRDRAATPNVIPPNSSATFVVAAQPLDISYLKPAFEPPGPSSRRHGVVISEVMYHPLPRADGRNLEFIEVYNSQPWFEDVSGWRIAGAVDYTFPSNTVLAAGSYRVIAAKPADFSAVYSNLPGVLGPFVGNASLPNDAGTLRLRNATGAIVFEMEYRDDPPWPAAADGAGHSLVLARPSYGERAPRAWDASDLIGGTPGTNDTQIFHGQRSLVINEILAHTDPPAVDYIELYNYSSSSSVNLNRCVLTDDPTTNKFVMTNLVLRPRSFIVFTEAELGFALNAGGETIYLKNASGTRVIDALRFGPQENGVPFGRFPDGAPRFSRLSSATPGTNNAPPRPPEVVINEIMYDPISGDRDDEYLELFNPGAAAVDLSGWRLVDGVDFTFPPGATLTGGGYLVVGRNAGRLRATYPHLTAANTLGDYTGALANGGERVALAKPDARLLTNAVGMVVTNIAYVVVDEVTYADGGRWGHWANGGGSSLELREARADRRLAPNWADSDESRKSAWVTVEATGVMDNGWAEATQLHVTLLGAGEALLDNVEVIPAGSTNLIGNGTFENGTDGWVFQGNHNGTTWEPGEGYNSARSLRLRATGRGDTGANRVRVALGRTLSSGTTVTLRAQARWLKGNPCLLLRLRGNWMEAPGYLLATRNLGTPGLPNSRAAANVGPAITEVRHWPALPPANTPVLVTAFVHDPDGLAFLGLNYRLDPATNYTTLPMTNNGAGLYSAVLPAQPNGAAAAFFIEALDNFPTPAASRFPHDAPERECLVRWGDTTNAGTLGAYRLWISATNVARWAAEEKMSNNPKDLTFIYGTNRVIYNAGGLFHGSPYHSPGYNSHVGNSCDYDLIFPRDDRLLGETDINLFRPGNGGGDPTGQREIHAYWFASQFGLPFLYHRPVIVWANGLRRGTVFHDAQQPNGEYVEQWFPDDAEGDLHKVQLGFEFGDQAYGSSEPGYAVVGASLARFTTTGGVKKLARYRQTWQRRAAPIAKLHDYTNIFDLVEVVLTNAPLHSAAYTRALTNAVDVEEWFKVHVVQHLYNNTDSFSYGGGQNAYAYKPTRAPWQLLIWDNDFAFGGAPDDSRVFNIGGADHGPRNDHAPFNRLYWQALIEAVHGMMTAERSNPLLDARYAGLVAGGAAVSSPQPIKDFIAQRRAYLLTLIATNVTPFRITSNGGADFATNRNLVTLTGTAPIEVRTLLVNGVPLTLTWTTSSNWTARLPLLEAGTNTLVFTALDARGAPVAGVSSTLRIHFTGVPDPPQRVGFNEIHYNPAVPGTAFVEIYNSSASTAYDLSGWRIEGVDYTFPAGTFIEPDQFLVVAANAATFAATFTTVTNLVGEFRGGLDNGGETLRLVKPGPSPAQDEVVDSVTYDDDPPWPAEADGGGYSLQLIDPAQDHNRVANWFGGFTHSGGWRFMSTNALVTGTNVFIWLDRAGDAYLDDVSLVPASGPLAGLNVLTNGGFDSPFEVGWFFLGTNLTQSAIVPDPAGSGGATLRVVAIGSGGITRAIAQTIPPEARNLTNTLSYWYRPGTGATVLTVRTYPGSLMQTHAPLDLAEAITPLTPGSNNAVRAALPPFPLVWLNELQPTNLHGPTDAQGEREPWAELFNSGPTPLDVGGLFLSDDLARLNKWAFPSDTVIGPGQFLLVWLDGEPEESTAGELHANFRPHPTAGLLLLSRLASGAPTILDYLRYQLPVAGRSFGSVPDGNPRKRQSFYFATPAAANNPAEPPVSLFINEWMADNEYAHFDPADGHAEDWFELYNADTNAVDLGGYFLTDNLTNKFQFRIPAGYSVPARGYLLVWADGEPGQNSTNRAALHVSFKLDKAGEAIGLFAPDGTQLDAVTFGPQFANVSQGRFPDGSASLYYLTNSTPGRPNVLPLPNTPPSLDPLPDWMVMQDTWLRFTVTARDADVPAQTLRFSLDPDAPAGAALDAESGEFSWRPTAEHGPGPHQFTVRVSDDGLPPLSATAGFRVTVAPPPRLGAVTLSGAEIRFAWPAPPGIQFQVQYTTDLSAPHWQDLGPPGFTGEGWFSFSDPIRPGEQRFYRVVVRQTSSAR